MLRVRNAIYEQVFDEHWVRDHLRLNVNWRRRLTECRCDAAGADRRPHDSARLVRLAPEGRGRGVQAREAAVQRDEAMRRGAIAEESLNKRSRRCRADAKARRGAQGIEPDRRRKRSGRSSRRAKRRCDRIGRPWPRPDADRRPTRRDAAVRGGPGRRHPRNTARSRLRPPPPPPPLSADQQAISRVLDAYRTAYAAGDIKALPGSAGALARAAEEPSRRSSPRGRYQVLIESGRPSSVSADKQRAIVDAAVTRRLVRSGVRPGRVERFTRRTARSLANHSARHSSDGSTGASAAGRSVRDLTLDRPLEPRVVTTARRDRRRLRAQRARGGDRLAQAGLAVVVFEAEPTDRRRRALRRADAARLRARCLLRRPSVRRRVAVLPVAAARDARPRMDRAAGHARASVRRWRAAVIVRSIDATAAGSGATASAYRRLIGSVAGDWPTTRGVVLGPPRLPRHPLALARFGLRALRSAERWRSALSRAIADARAVRRHRRARHAAARPRPTAAFGLVLGAIAHVRRLADAARRRTAARPTRSRRTCDRSAARSSPACA